MIYPQVNVSEWCELYGIVPVPSECRKCGEQQFFTSTGAKPFAYLKWRGVISDHDKCGAEFQQSIFTSCNKQERLELSKIFEELK